MLALTFVPALIVQTTAPIVLPIAPIAQIAASVAVIIVPSVPGMTWCVMRSAPENRQSAALLVSTAKLDVSPR